MWFFFILSLSFMSFGGFCQLCASMLWYLIDPMDALVCVRDSQRGFPSSDAMDAISAASTRRIFGRRGRQPPRALREEEATRHLWIPHHSFEQISLVSLFHFKFSGPDMMPSIPFRSRMMGTTVGSIQGLRLRFPNDRSWQGEERILSKQLKCRIRGRNHTLAKMRSVDIYN